MDLLEHAQAPIRDDSKSGTTRHRYQPRGTKDMNTKSVFHRITMTVLVMASLAIFTSMTYAGGSQESAAGSPGQHMMSGQMRGGHMMGGTNGYMMSGIMMGPHGSMMDYEPMMMSRLLALDLTMEQQQSVENIQAQTREKVTRQQDDLEASWTKVDEMLMKSPPDEKAIRKALDACAKQEVEMQMLWVDALDKSQDVLTEDQLARFSDPSWQPSAGMSSSSGMHSRGSMHDEQSMHHMGGHT
jgi:Spy/CpxP family protein refolding chaperone